MTDSLIADGLRKSYGATKALDGFDLRVEAGRIHALLGPNGAGKTTAVRVLTTLSRADGGTATVDGIDVIGHPARVRARIGMIGQSHAVDEILGGRENLIMFGRLAGLRMADARRRADELLDAFDLAEAARRPVGGYSGGMRRRLDIAAGLILLPAVLFLDEPTTGLDPRGRNEVWAAVRAAAAQGTTVLMTTQYLDEADQLASKVSVMDAGRVIAEGSPLELKARLGADRIVTRLAHADDLAAAAATLSTALGREAVVDADERELEIEAPDGTASLFAAVTALERSGIVVDDLELRRPTLDEVFLALTAKGRS
jgi:ABC-2 type transport system ATP-binding protein